MILNIRSILKIMGLTLMVISMSMLPSFLVSIIYDDKETILPFFMTIFIAGITGFILLRANNSVIDNLRVRDGFFIVTLCWFISALVGAIPFITTGSIPHPADAIFESCSGFSTTGASILTDIENLPRGILFWRSFTHWIGGMGILIFGIALMPSLGISGQNIAVSESPGLSLDKNMAKMTDTAKTLYAIYLIITLAEVILLLMGGMSLYDALIHTFGTVGTGGFSSYNDSMGHFDSTYIRIVITTLMFICGGNFNLYYSIGKKGIRALIHDAEFKTYSMIFVSFSLVISIILIISNTYPDYFTALIESAFQTSSILTTTGYSTADYETWPLICQMLILCLMFVGGCSSSTGGGVKVIRILIILKLIKRGVLTRLHPNAIQTVKLGNVKISSDVASAVANHMFLYIAMVIFGAFIISFENHDMITCFSSVITCIGNVGPGFGLIGPSDNFSIFSSFSKILLSVYMIAGRLELYTLFVLLTPGFWSQNH